MTRKDFELIAGIFNKNITSTNARETEPFMYSAVAVNKAVAQQFAYVLATTNPNFDKQRFLGACGVTE